MTYPYRERDKEIDRKFLEGDREEAFVEFLASFFKALTKATEKQKTNGAEKRQRTKEKKTQ